MFRYTIEERIRIVQVYSRSLSIIAVQRDFKDHFHKRTSPSKNAIKALFNKFTETGCVTDQHRPGRTKMARNANTIARVSADVRLDPKTSIRKRSTQLGVSYSSVQRILTKDLKMHPYKVQLTQELKPTDNQARLDYAFA